jgi:glycosyltransferase involved in cell wall biosynthesis
MVIDIVTPTFNRATFLEKTLKSVTTQKTASEIHYYIMDGGSTDETIQIINCHIKDNTNQKIKIGLFIGKDQGMYDAIYKGFAKGHGDIMGWINSDDIYLPSALHTVETIFESYKEVNWIIGIPAQVNEFDAITGIHFGFPLKTRQGIQRGIYNFKNSRRLCPTIQQDAVFWRRSLWNKLPDAFFEKFRSSKYAGDLFLWQELAKHSGLYHVKSVLSCFRRHGNQLTNDLNKYAVEMNHEKPSIKETLVSLIINIPIVTPKILHYKALKRIHENLCKSYDCGMIVWDFDKRCWVTQSAIEPTKK